MLYLLLYVVVGLAGALAAAEAGHWLWALCHRWRTAQRAAHLSGRFEFDPKLEARLAHRILREKQLQRSAEALGRKRTGAAK